MVSLPRTVRCPTCRRETRWTGNPYRPFCSERCRVVDLGNWAAERYRIPDAPAGEDRSPDAGDGEPGEP